MNLEIDWSDDIEEQIDAARALVVSRQWGSTSLIQRQLGFGYLKAARIMAELERRGVVGPYSGSSARDVLVAPDSEVAS